MKLTGLLTPKRIMLSCLFVLLFLTLTPSSLWAATIYVSSSGTGDGASPVTPANLKAALTTARANGQDDILYLQAEPYYATSSPAGGFSYTPAASDYTRSIKISGGWNSGFTYQSLDPNLTSLDGGNSYRVLEIKADGASFNFTFKIENLTIIRGYSNNPSLPPLYGAGLSAYQANGGTLNLYVKKCIFQNNISTGYYGGGMYANGYFELTDSVFSYNSATGGGGIFIHAPYTLSPVIDRCSFDNNKTSVLNEGGSDIINYASPVIKNSRFYGNADNSTSGGGAINHYFGGTTGAVGTLTLVNCIISGKKSSYWGAGIHIWNGNANIFNTLFLNNQCGASGDGAGGGITIYNPTASGRTVNVHNCTFVKNRTLGGQTYGGAIYNRVQTLNVTNSIFWDNGTNPIYQSGSGSVTVAYSDVQGGYTGTGNLNIIPDFVDFTNNNFHLAATSPCKDTGTNNPSGTPLYQLYPTSSDLDGRQRILDGGISETVDMGAYEYDNGPYANASGRGDPNLAYDPVNNRYLAVYNSADGTGGGRLYGRLINPDGTPNADQFQISEQKSYNRMLSAVTYDAFHQKFVAVWDIFNASTNDMDIQGQLVNPDGTLDGYNFTVSNKAGVAYYGPAIAYDGTNNQTLAVWNKYTFPTDEEDVFGRFFVKDVAQGADEFAVSAVVGSDQGLPAVAFDPGNNQFLVVFADVRDSPTHEVEIFGQLIASNRTLIGSNFRIVESTSSPGDQIYPAVAFNPTTQKYLVAWEDSRNGDVDIYGRVVNHDGTLVGNSFPIGAAVGYQRYVSTAYDSMNQRFLAAWQDKRNEPTTGWDIYGQWFDGNGLPTWPNFGVIRTVNDQQFPKVAYGFGSFLMVYEIDYASGTPMFDVGFKEIKGTSFLFLPLILRQ